MPRIFRCPIVVTAAVVGVSAVAVALYYLWTHRKKNVESGEVDVLQSPNSDSRVGAGQDDEESSSSSCGNMFKFPDEKIRKTCERLFLEQMDLGETFMEEAETVERGAMHMANAIVLTGETEQMLKVLRKNMHPANFCCIQKYIPSADMRVNQLLQDELTMEAIAEHFE